MSTVVSDADVGRVLRSWSDQHFATGPLQLDGANHMCMHMYMHMYMQMYMHVYVTCNVRRDAKQMERTVSRHTPCTIQLYATDKVFVAEDLIIG